MSVNIKTSNGINEINKMYLKTSDGVSQVGKVYEYDGTTFKPIYNAELIAVQNSTLINNTTLTEVRTGSSWTSKSGTTVTINTNAGAVFGNSTCKFSPNFMDYDKVTITATCSGDTSGTGNDGYCPNFFIIGTASKIAGAYFKSFYEVFLNGCTAINSRWNSNGTYTFNYTRAITSNEPLYIAMIIGGYNGQIRTMKVDYMYFE